MPRQMLFAKAPAVTAAVALLLCWPGVASSVEAPAGQSSRTPAAASRPVADTQPASDTQIDDAIQKLGDPDPQVREQAGKLLWSRGHAAEAALKQATTGPDPEVARRAVSILRDFAYGLNPDTPREVFALLEQYRRGDMQLKRAAASALGTRGVHGLRVLLRLGQDERDESLKRTIRDLLSARGHDVAVLMLVDGDVQGARKLLEKAAPDSPTAAQDYAAVLLLTGGLNDALLKLKSEPPRVRDATLTVALARAAGDLATARAAAEKSSNAELLESVLVDQGDWKALAERTEIDPLRLEPAEQLGFLCAFYRLAGDQAGYGRMVQRLIARGQQVQGDLANCVEDLCLNDKPDEAIELLLREDDYLGAANFLAPRLRFREALELPDRARKTKPADVLKLKARSIAAMHFVGEIDQARRTLADAVAENRLGNDFATWVYLVDGARVLGLKDQADEYCCDALDTVKAHDQLPWLFEKMRFGDGHAAVKWWQFIRQVRHTQSTRQKLDLMHQIFDQTIGPKELDALLDEARSYAQQFGDPQREDWLMTVADTLADLGRDDLAGQWLRRLAQGSGDPPVLIRAGDFEASQGHWDDAADDYDRAWERNPTDAAALFLRGWATAQGGRDADGRAMMELAHRVPLGSEIARHALLDVLLRHKLGDDARRECELIIKTTSARPSWEKNDALRRLAEDTAARGDELAAADLWERAFLDNERNSISFQEPWANVIVPALIHRTRALGLIKAGKVAQGVKEARLSLDECPADADVLIDTVNALDKSGHRGEADELFGRQAGVYRKLATDYPGSGAALNELAWAQVKCGRELDEALANAKRAVALEPANTASIDTLAEICFARGDVPGAIEQIKRCIELEPKVERHRRQLERFQGARQPDTAPAR